MRQQPPNKVYLVRFRLSTGNIKEILSITMEPPNKICCHQISLRIDNFIAILSVTMKPLPPNKICYHQFSPRIGNLIAILSVTMKLLPPNKICCHQFTLRSTKIKTILIVTGLVVRFTRHHQCHNSPMKQFTATHHRHLSTSRTVIVPCYRCCKYRLLKKMFFFLNIYEVCL